MLNPSEMRAVAAALNPFDLRNALMAKHAQHVVLVHFPIALCIVGVAFDVAALWKNRKAFADAAFYNLTIAIDCASIEFFEYDCTEPKGRIRSEPAQCQDRIVSSPECGNVNGRVEQGRLHLTTQRAVYVLDVNSALDETFSGFENQSVALVFGNRQIQRPLDGLSLGFRSQSFLDALDFHWIQLKVLVRPNPCRCHERAPFPSP